MIAVSVWDGGAGAYSSGDGGAGTCAGKSYDGVDNKNYAGEATLSAVIF
ncbi:hypothetical protein [Corynebacterium kroppenstedtii]|jgi:hypothetical protein|nr:hypothetical protein [Corynebacterium kroppenstedtii]MDU7286334.1 hypothetical protein [Corynebacterium kroppenstedtii]